MKKELFGILVLFLFILTSLSLVSYSAQDPSCFHDPFTVPDDIHNLFGLLGAHLSGLLVFLFGLGSFWMPVLLLTAAVWYLKGRSGRVIALTFLGGLLVILSTGGILTLFQDTYSLLGTRFSSGGVLSVNLTAFFLTYTNPVGTAIIFLFFLITGIVLTTGVSFFTMLVMVKKSVMRLAASIKKDFEEGISYIRTLSEKRKQKEYGIDITPAASKKRKDAGKNTKSLPGPESGNADDEAENHETEPVIKAEKFDQDADAGFHVNLDDIREHRDFVLPSLSFLNDKQQVVNTVDTEKLKEKSRILKEKFMDFNITGEVVEIIPGPVITTFEYRPAPGIKISKIVNLSDDLALALSAVGIRILAPIPGKDVVGIEIPNDTREDVILKELINSREFAESESRLTLAIGKDITGRPVVAPMDSMPHLLIAGATGTGKSVGLNAMIISLIYKATPDEVKFIMIDPKRIELSVYDDIPHLISPVVTDMKKATNALFWAVREMERRYELLAETGTRNIDQYNRYVEEKLAERENTPVQEDAGFEPDGEEGSQSLYEAEGVEEPEKLPFIVIIVDEFADLMMVSSKDVESALTRLAQMARAAGMHLILATQRPSVDVLTGIIKANFPTRISFQVSSKTDSRTILDSNGSEKLLGRGDMLFLPPGTGKLQRIQCAFISEKEIEKVTRFLKKQRKPSYVEDVTMKQDGDTSGTIDESEYDEKYDEAVALVTRTKQASISSVQRHLRIGYNRAARIIEMMEQEGVVGPSDGSKPREVLVRSYDD
ncbi:MAG: DNA translocase FtsK 4TM domain-containing protein [Desulfobacteraceae bacterium]